MEPQLMVQCVGAVVTYFSARMCHSAFVASIDVWYSSPANRHVYFKAFKEKYNRTGKEDYSLLMRTHPETLSETFGDEATSEGQMVKAMVEPSTVLMAIGGIMMRCGGQDMWGFVFHAARGLLTPFGLLMVLQTPVVSGAGAGNKEIRAGKKVSNIEMLYQLNWVMLHFAGFALFLGPVVFIELPVAITELVNGEGFETSFEGNADAWLIDSRFILAVMRVLCGILLIAASPFLGKAKTRNPNTLTALHWRAEFTVGEFGASQMYFNALSVWLQPGVGPYRTMDLVLLGFLALEAFRIFFRHAVYWLYIMCRWDSIDWAAEVKKAVPAQGPVMQGLREVTSDELVFLHGVQAGVPDSTEWIVKASSYLPSSMVATGCNYPKIKLLVLRPDNYENFRAIDFSDLSNEDLVNWNHDLGRVLSALPTSDTLFLPSGYYKLDMMLPKALLSIADYESDVELLGVVPNEIGATESDGDVAFNVTSKFLSDPRCAFLLGRSFADSAKEPGMAEFYKVIGELGNQIEDAAKAQQLANGTLDKFESDGSDADIESGTDTPLLALEANMPMAYEIQIRGVKQLTPMIVLRVPQSQALPVGWQHLPPVSPMPASAK
ncbi:unnamed protein product [Effrenium voratum]|nr:unnamed protein product [Effrenium voratum]